MRVRQATVEDVPRVCEIEAAYRPDEPLDPVVERYRWQTEEPGVTTERWLAEDRGHAVGYAILFHADWSRMTQRIAIAQVGWDPAATETLSRLVDLVEDRARALGTSLLLFYCREDDVALTSLLDRAGYRLDTLARVWELDLRQHRDRLLALTRASRAAMAEQGISLLPLSEHAVTEPLKEVYDAWSDSRTDVPRSHEMTPVSYELYRVWAGSPDHRPDRHWIATDRGRIVGFSFLRYPPAGGRVWTGFTGTVRSHRGRGIARAVKMETLAQAIELGIDSVRTDNDQRNAPMLHINQDLGYEPRPAWADYQKLL